MPNSPEKSNNDEAVNDQQDSEMIIKKLREEVEDLKQRNIEFETEVEKAIVESDKKYKEKLDAKDTEIADLKKQIDELKSSQSDVNQQDIAKLEQENKKLNNEIEQLLSDLKAKSDKISHYQGSSSDLEKKNKELRKELEALRNDKSELKNKENKYKKEIKQLQEEKTRLEQDMETQKEANQTSDRIKEIISGPKLDELLASEKIIESIYIRLKMLKEVKLKILAMQAGVSEASCKYAIGRLLEAKAIKYDGKNKIVTLLDN